MWFRFKRQAVPTRQAVLESTAMPKRLTPAKRPGRASLVLEILEDRFAPATLMQTFYPPETFAADTFSVFGVGTATNADFHVVSMPLADIDGVPDRGAAFVYSATTGALITTIVDPSSSSDVDDGFAWERALSLSGNMVVVGANGDDTMGENSGRAYVFDAPTGSLLATLADPSPAAGDRFGSSVAISGNTIVVGGSGGGARSASEVYVFNATTDALVATLANPSPASGDSYGVSVAISGNTVVVGAPWDDMGGLQSGQAYLFDATTGALVATLASPSPAASDNFSRGGVAVSGGIIAIGATGNT